MCPGDETTVTADGRLTGRDAPRPWCLRVLASGDRAQQGEWVPIAGELTLGRSEQHADLVFDDPRLSRRHVRLAPASGGKAWTVADLGSKNGTWVDGQRVHEDTTAAAGAVLRAGETLLELTRASLLPDGPDDPELVGEAAPHRALLTAIRRVAPSELPVLVIGETGTGKELVARRIHALSERRGRFVAANCAAIPRDLFESQLFGHVRGAFTGANRDQAGLFEQADEGTLFLDELGELPLEQQAKLLRVLETQEVRPVGAHATRRVDVRVVAATNADLDRRMEDGGFRADLYARVAGLVLRPVPLRERRGDVPMLLRLFLEQHRLDAEATEALVLHDWPLNVRGLRNLARGLALEDAGAALTLDQLPEAVRTRRGEPGAAPGVPTREAVEALLRQHGGNVSRVARHYGKDRTYVYRLLKRFGLDATAYRPEDA